MTDVQKEQRAAAIVQGISELSVETTKEKIQKHSTAMKGISPWNKGIPMSTAAKRKLSEANKGNRAWNKDIPWSSEMKQKLSDAHQGQCPWNKGLDMKAAGYISWNKGVPQTTEMKLRISTTLKAKAIKPKWTGKKVSREQTDKINIAKGCKPISVFDLDGVFVGKWITKSFLIKDLGISGDVGGINRNLKGKTKSYKGFNFVQ